ncbi:GTPase [Lentiprolixibacter aurantiacus]|uniref:GTPase n=1 Tax=Lentiprolixibacter aurantiacus TaxID=2993939 RepID=A0AAE3SN57_9FLAO|nr:GTPase [Lentiprolixibacter aurantiacus]MCX2719160.1 GTPase [Lentiprolixibacter aurantiacus]
MGKEAIRELFFIYNADSGLKNAILDGAHKVLSPATYECNLCQLTHGAFFERKVWKDFRQRHEFPMRFLHKDEFVKGYASKFGHKFTYPIVLGGTNSGLEVVIGTGELNELSETEALIKLLEERI